PLDVKKTYTISGVLAFERLLDFVRVQQGQRAFGCGFRHCVRFCLSRRRPAYGLPCISLRRPWRIRWHAAGVWPHQRFGMADALPLSAALPVVVFPVRSAASRLGRRFVGGLEGGGAGLAASADAGTFQPAVPARPLSIPRTVFG